MIGKLGVRNNRYWEIFFVSKTIKLWNRLPAEVLAFICLFILAQLKPTPCESGNGMRYMAPWILNVSAYTD
jgi:hypothetical protein